MWKDIETFLYNPGAVIEQLATQMQIQDGEAVGLHAGLAKFQRSLQALNTEQDTVITLFRLDQIQLEETDIQRDIENVQEQLRCVQEKESCLRSAKELLHDLSQHLKEPLTWELRRQLIEVLVEVIRVDTVEDSAGRKQAKVTVIYRFGDSTAIGMGTPCS